MNSWSADTFDVDLGIKNNSNGYVLQHVSERSKDDKEVVQEAFKTYPIHAFASEKLQKR